MFQALGRVSLVGGVVLVGCTRGAVDERELPPAMEDWSADLVHTELRLDLAAMEGTARIELTGARAASFEAAGLEILEVFDDEGPLDHLVDDGRLDVGVPGDELTVRFGFAVQEPFEGYMERGASLTWPTYCGNLFPCRSDPAEGQTYALEVVGVPEGEVAVYPEALVTQAPAYQVGFTHGAYTEEVLGTTTAGTEVVIWYFPNHAGSIHAGTSDLVAAVDWLEQTLGPYPWGDRMGSVEVDWGPSSYAGMEHHPYSHISLTGLVHRSIHIHEAAHGWYGDGVRLACWEDLVLSEGTVSYLTARAVGQVDGPEAEAEVWEGYAELLEAGGEGVAWPDTCNEVDVLEHLFSWRPYMRGAYFYRAVAEEVGVETLDGVLGSFAREHVGEAAGMQDLLDHLHARTGFDPGPLAQTWLRTAAIPET